MAARKLLAGEIALIRKLLEFGDRAGLGAQLEDVLVRSLDERSLGCFRFIPADGRPRKFGDVAATGEAADTDHVLISFALNLDTGGELFELDAWKEDYTPVTALPDAEKLQK